MRPKSTLTLVVLVSVTAIHSAPAEAKLFETAREKLTLMKDKWLHSDRLAIEKLRKRLPQHLEKAENAKSAEELLRLQDERLQESYDTLIDEGGFTENFAENYLQLEQIGVGSTIKRTLRWAIGKGANGFQEARDDQNFSRILEHDPRLIRILAFQDLLPNRDMVQKVAEIVKSANDIYLKELGQSSDTEKAVEAAHLNYAMQLARDPGLDAGLTEAVLYQMGLETYETKFDKNKVHRLLRGKDLTFPQQRVAQWLGLAGDEAPTPGSARAWRKQFMTELMEASPEIRKLLRGSPEDAQSLAMAVLHAQSKLQSGAMDRSTKWLSFFADQGLGFRPLITGVLPSLAIETINRSIGGADEIRFLKKAQEWLGVAGDPAEPGSERAWRAAHLERELQDAPYREDATRNITRAKELVLAMGAAQDFYKTARMSRDTPQLAKLAALGMGFRPAIPNPTQNPALTLLNHGIEATDQARFLEKANAYLKSTPDWVTERDGDWRKDFLSKHEWKRRGISTAHPAIDHPIADVAFGMALVAELAQVEETYRASVQVQGPTVRADARAAADRQFLQKMKEAGFPLTTENLN